ncbi:FadR/GntR family transcriptional regulator [Isoptericola croceus]|uniref:FadR/GntR family transcriptional regulator n=1 Tax=Isoptericola croceus TaxID=3031406 RepID=UPI0023F9ED40|nr:FadR/GntR family transcriptional regulator [Isoptericola croceus]
MSRTDEVVDGIKRMILAGELSPGDRLPVENELAEALGVSRGSLREGVRALSILGIVHTRQGDGTYVTSLDPGRLLAPMGFVVELQGDSSARPFHQVRRILETEAAAQAALRITDEGLAESRTVLDGVPALLAQAPVDHDRFIEADIAFHRIVAAHSGNPVIAALTETLASRTVRERLLRGQRQSGAEERAHADHEAIWRALADRDPDRARTHMAAHLLTVEESLPTG